MPDTPSELDQPRPPASPDVIWHVERPAPPQRPRERYWLHALLFALVLLTTTHAGALHWLAFRSDFGVRDIGAGPLELALRGLWYSVTMLAILGAHEAGHYLACRYHRTAASLPYFLPLPMPFGLFGTLGAFIRIRQPIATKSALFDIGVAGPIAGFLVAVPALFIGLSMSNTARLPEGFLGLELGEPLLFKAAAWLAWGDIPTPLSLNLHPVAFAAWFGLLVTALNLLPIGQLDGGHIAYAVFGRRSLFLSVGAVGVGVGLCFYSLSWILWVALIIVLLSIFGWRHPPTWDEHVRLDAARIWLAAGAFLIFVLCFTPAPIRVLDLIRPQ